MVDETEFYIMAADHESRMNDRYPRPNKKVPENKAPDENCIFCNGYGKIRYEYRGEYCNDIAEDICPCTHHNHVKAKLIKLIDMYIVSDDYDKVDQIKQRNKYLEREGLGFLIKEVKP